MTKSHHTERIIFIFSFINPFFSISAIILNLFKHFNYRLICSAVKRAP